MEQTTLTSKVRKTVKTYKTIKKVLLFFNISTPLLILGLILIFIIGIGLLTSSSGKNTNMVGAGNLNLSESTLQWQSAVEKEATEQGVPELIPYIMAIIEVESKGMGTDIMQSGESAGLGVDGFDDPLKSIEQGVKYLKNSKAKGDSLGFTDFWAIVQSYNFGSAYVTYLATNNKTHSVEVAEDYSKNVVAPSLGNTVGTTYSYVNSVSSSYGKTYLYRNGGNFFYADLVRQYVSAGSSEIPLGDDLFQQVMAEALVYNGWSYVWGGSNPSMGFDCSGLVQWTYGKAGITLPRVANQQWTATEEIDIKDAQPGDLIFFKGTYGAPDYISHVGIYVDETRMYDANDSGVGYHYWTGSYWMSHFDSIRRISK